MPPGVAFGGAGVGNIVSQNTLQLSNPRPVPEKDKIARLNAIFQGVSGLLTSSAEAFQRLRFNPEPLIVRSDTDIPALSTRFFNPEGGRPTVVLGGGAQPALGSLNLTSILPLVIIGGGIILAVSLFRK